MVDMTDAMRKKYEISNWVVHFEDERTRLVIEQLIIAMDLTSQNTNTSKKEIYFYGRTLPTLNINFDIAEYLADMRLKTKWKFSLHYKLHRADRILWNECRRKADNRLRSIRNFTVP